MLSNHKGPQGFILALAAFGVFAAADAADKTADAQTTATVAFTADGVVHSTDGGFQFPDGSVQSTAASGAGTIEEIVEAIRHLSVNQSVYDNRVPEVTHDSANVEVCFKGGATHIDENAAGESTAGGDCEPGDIGWMLERDERPALSWTLARASCLKLGMRLPEVFEYQWTCDMAPTIGIVDMTDNLEWVSNEVQPRHDTSFAYLAAAVLGDGSCGHGGWRSVARTDGNRNIEPYRCAL